MIVEEEEAIRLPVPSKREYTQGLRPAEELGVAGPVLPEDGEESTSSDLAVDVDPEESWERVGPAVRIPVGYVILGGVFAGCAVIWAFALILSAENPIISEISEVTLRRAEEEVEHREAQEYLERLEELTAQYLAAETVEEKVRHVRHAERVGPLMRDFHARTPLVPCKLLRIDNIAPVGLELHSFLVVRATVMSAGEESLRLLVLEETAEGDLLFDWEAEVGYQPIPLDRYIADQPVDPVELRLFVRRDTFYCFEFSDSEEFQCYKLTERDSSEFLFGYARKGGGVDRALGEMLGPDWSAQEPALLRVRFLPGTGSIRSVLIEELVGPRWSYLENPAKAQ